MHEIKNAISNSHSFHSINLNETRNLNEVFVVLPLLRTPQGKDPHTFWGCNCSCFAVDFILKKLSIFASCFIVNGARPSGDMQIYGKRPERKVKYCHRYLKSLQSICLPVFRLANSCHSLFLIKNGTGICPATPSFQHFHL